MAALVASAVLSVGVLRAPPADASSCVASASSAQDFRSAGKLRDARAALQACARPSCNAVVRTDCERWLKEVEDQIPSVVVRAVDTRGHTVTGVKATLDAAAIELDGTPLVVDPGPHVLRVRARSGDVAELRSSITLGEKARVLEVRFDVALEEDGSRAPEAPPAKEPDKEKDKVEAPSEPSEGGGPSYTLPIVFAGIGGVAAIAFGIFELKGQSGYTDLKNGCNLTHSCKDSDIDPVRTDFVGAGVSLAVAVVALAAAAVLYLTTPEPNPHAKHTSRALGFTF